MADTLVYLPEFEYLGAFLFLTYQDFDVDRSTQWVVLSINEMGFKVDPAYNGSCCQ